VLNSCFLKILVGMRDNSCEHWVCNLCYLASALKHSADKHPLESNDILERLYKVQTMLVRCMNCNSMDDSRNVARVLRDSRMDYTGVFAVEEEDDLRTYARIFLTGPLVLCIDDGLDALLGTAQVLNHDLKLTPDLLLELGEVTHLHLPVHG